MNYTTMVLQLVAAMAMAVLVTGTHKRLPPALAARVLTVTIVLVVAAAAPSMWLIALGYLAHLRIFGVALGWCTTALDTHARVPAWAGLPSLMVVVSATFAAVRVTRTHLRLRCHGASPVEVAHHAEPFAFTLPGRDGQIVISSALVELLDGNEQAVVLAHERAHSTYRHDRYLVAAQLAATLPLMRPLARRLRYSLERWADELAAKHCGDRRFVARTVSKVALGDAMPAGALGFGGGLGVTGRVAALLEPPNRAPRSAVLVGLWAAIGGTGFLAAFDLHHLASLVSALCPG